VEEKELVTLIENIVTKKAVAGKVAILPKGDWNASRVYERLDMVRYNNCLYVAKKDNTSIIPTNTDYWMLCVTNDATEQKEVRFLPAGATTVVFNVNGIKENSLVKVQADSPVMQYDSITVNGNEVTVTFPAQETDAYVELTITDRLGESSNYIETGLITVQPGEGSVTFTDIPLISGASIKLVASIYNFSYKKIEVTENSITVNFTPLDREFELEAVIDL